MHFDHLQRCSPTERLVLAGPTLGRINTGIAVFEADDEAAARAVMDSDPVIVSGFATGELREFPGVTAARPT